MVCLVIHVLLLVLTRSLPDIKRAIQILTQMRDAHANSRGAFGLAASDGSGSMEMVDAPMLKQV